MTSKVLTQLLVPCQKLVTSIFGHSKTVTDASLI